MPLSEDELTELFTACDTDNSGEINYLEFLDMVNKSPPMVQPREMTVLPALRPGVRESDMRHAQKLAKESIIAHHKRLDSAFKHMDSNRSGFITRQDLLKMWESAFRSANCDPAAKLSVFASRSPKGSNRHLVWGMNP